MNAESVNGEVGGVEQTAPTRPARGPLTLLLDTIGSVWFGVTMLFFILVYAWLGSAGLAPLLHWTAVREFEKTEMEWYAWWPFNAMIAAFSIALILVTLRKIKFSVFNLGVWVVHVGILVLVTGCLIYFGTKIEGDMLVYRHQAVISAGGGEPSTIVLRRGEQTQVKAPDGTSYSVEVMGFTPGYTLLTGEDKGKKTYSTRLSVSRAGGKAKPTAFVRQVLTGYPQYTEDVIPGKGRAIKTIGKRVVDDALDVKLIHAPARTLYLVEKMALLVRKVGTEAWTEYPMPDLPRYHEYLREPNDVRLPMSERDIRIRTIDQPIARGGEDAGGVGDGASFRVTGFLPYARPGALWEAGEDADAATATTEPAPNPYVRYRVKMGQAVQRFAMLAKDPQNAERTIGDVRMRFLWLEDEDGLKKLEQARPTEVTVRVKDPPVEAKFPLDDIRKEVTIKGTPYSIKLVEFYPDWKLATKTRQGRSASVAMIEVKGGPKGTYTRTVVSPFVELSQDSTADGNHMQGITDKNIHMEVSGGGFRGLTVVGGHAGLHVILNSRDGKVQKRAATVDKPITFDGLPLEVTVEAVSREARQKLVPRLIPRVDRNPNDRRIFSMVQVEVERGGKREKQWLQFSPYAHPNRLGFSPATVKTGGGDALEILYCRERIDLGVDVVLDDFNVERYPGKEEVRNYISTVRFKKPDGSLTDAETVASNDPAEFGAWWFFQSTWDPPQMSYTGLGVGNRNGLLIMLLGSILVALGTSYAFYVKPVLIRNHKRRIEEKRAAQAPAAPAMGGVVGGLLLMALFTGCSGGSSSGDVRMSVSRDFAGGLDLERFRLLAVQEKGRVKTVDSLARETLKYVNAKAIRKADPVLLYLDMLFSPEYYFRANIISIRKKHIRRDLIQGIRARIPAPRRQGAISDAELERIMDTGLVSPQFLLNDVVRSQLSVMSRDLLRTDKEVQALHYAVHYASPETLTAALKVIPPPQGDPIDPWFPLGGAGAMPKDAAHAGVIPKDGNGKSGLGVPGLDPAKEKELTAAFEGLRAAWGQQDAESAQKSIDQLSSVLPTVKPEYYPNDTRLGIEHWYYRNQKLTEAWYVYLLGAAFLLMAIVFQFTWARRVGYVLFFAGFAAHTTAIGLRWYLAGRIPNSNMYEATIASAWFGCVVAIVIEIMLRKRDYKLRAVPAFCGAVAAMLALMIGNLLPAQIPATFSGDIATVAPLLDRTVWLYIHTNLIIASYALIFFGGVTALLYMVVRCGYEVALTVNRFPGLKAIWLGGTGDVPARGGAASIILSGGPKHDMEKAGLSTALDGATMIFMELGFLSLWVGTILGAWWADQSWGRPWGWDPKEVFALNTWIIFLILIHVRLKTKDKALWTALLAIAGCAAMLFNWIGVNFWIVGLHSYA